MLTDYDIQQDYLYGLGKEIGLQKGEQKGEQKSKTQMASIMLKNNEHLSKIIMYTGLSEMDIKSILDKK